MIYADILRIPSLALSTGQNSSLTSIWAQEWLFLQTPFTSELTIYQPNSNCSRCTPLRSDMGRLCVLQHQTDTQHSKLHFPLLCPQPHTGNHFRESVAVRNHTNCPSAIGRGSLFLVAFGGQTLQQKHSWGKHGNFDGFKIWNLWRDEGREEALEL